MPGAFGQPLPGDDDAPRLPPQPPGRFRDVGNPWDHPEAREFADHVRDVTIPALEGSTYGIGMLSSKSTGADFDVRQAVEIGAMLLMGKPLILGVQPDAHVPAGLARAADEIVELDLELDSAGAAAALQAAMARIDARRGTGGDTAGDTAGGEG